MANTMNTPVQRPVEAEYPQVEAYHLIPDSGGRGTYREGLGLRRVYRILAREAQVTSMTERNIATVRIVWGEPGRPFRITLNPQAERDVCVARRQYGCSRVMSLKWLALVAVAMGHRPGAILPYRHWIGWKAM